LAVDILVHHKEALLDLERNVVDGFRDVGEDGAVEEDVAILEGDGFVGEELVGLALERWGKWEALVHFAVQEGDGLAEVVRAAGFVEPARVVGLAAERGEEAGRSEQCGQRANGSGQTEVEHRVLLA
jgi:hypothetical protein